MKVNISHGNKSIVFSLGDGDMTMTQSVHRTLALARIMCFIAFTEAMSKFSLSKRAPRSGVLCIAKRESVRSRHDRQSRLLT